MGVGTLAALARNDTSFFRGVGLVESSIILHHYKGKRDWQTGKESSWDAGGSSLHHSVFSRGGRYLAEESWGNVVVREQQLYGGHEEIFRIDDGDIYGGPEHFEFSPLNRLYFAGYQTIEIFDPVTRQWVDSFQLGSDYYDRNLASSPDESLLAVTNYNKISIWDIKEEKLLVEFDAHFLYVLDLTFSPDGRYLATSSLDGTVRLWGIVP
jgi:WD40 repeat protein